MFWSYWSMPSPLRKHPKLKGCLQMIPVKRSTACYKVYVCGISVLGGLTLSGKVKLSMASCLYIIGCSRNYKGFSMFLLFLFKLWLRKSLKCVWGRAHFHSYFDYAQRLQRIILNAVKTILIELFWLEIWKLQQNCLPQFQFFWTQYTYFCSAEWCECSCDGSASFNDVDWECKNTYIVLWKWLHF